MGNPSCFAPVEQRELLTGDGPDPFRRLFSLIAHPAGPAGVVNGRPHRVTV
jgi:hypothetical protein